MYKIDYPIYKNICTYLSTYIREIIPENDVYIRKKKGDILFESNNIESKADYKFVAVAEW